MQAASSKDFIFIPSSNGRIRVDAVLFYKDQYQILAEQNNYTVIEYGVDKFDTIRKALKRLYAVKGNQK